MQLLFMPFELDQFLPFQISQITNKISRALAVHYENEFRISRTQWRILAVLWGGSHSAQHIADKTVMDKSAISRAVRGLLDKGLISRGSSQADGRLAPLSLTPKGRRVTGQIIEKINKAEQAIFESFTAGDLQHLNKVLMKLEAALN